MVLRSLLPMPAELARGVEACRGKILGKQAGIDDRTLEVTKVAVMRSNEEVPLPGARSFVWSAKKTATSCSPG